MPTLKPRVSITMEPGDLAILDRYAAASGTPRATIVSGLIASAIPELGRAAELIEMANAAPRHIREGIVENLSNATADALGFLEPFHGDFILAMNHLQRELPIDQAKRREGRLPSAAGRLTAAATPRRKPGPNPHSLTGGSK